METKKNTEEQNEYSIEECKEIIADLIERINNKKFLNFMCDLLISFKNKWGI